MLQMNSFHKMIVALAIVGLLAFVVWTEFIIKLNGVGLDSDEAAVRLSQPSMEGPRGAIPSTAPGTWVRSQDYPQMALDGDIEGRTVFSVTVSEFGEVSACQIIKPSGYKEFDDRVCSAVSTRAKFFPALDKNDLPVEGRYTNTVVWRLEE
ncbi:MAG: hypothetical protein DI637_12855 [Citromicrobium sp.]|nr:MAG: hypothetical protein DI637_12855 [Citromicrobium sp.]